ncbi:MAG TPA: hypothetical protein VN704_07810 [Verrucomicrobiae bacterium]|nr:hypothetical protein [Verrucomicrobiae bacterium]
MFFNNDPNLLDKPDIVFGNYFFVWDEDSPGLYSNEIGKFKIFIKNMIPYLEMIMMKLVNINDINSFGYDSSVHLKSDIKKMIFDKGKFTLSSKHDNHVLFVLNIDKEGDTTFFREEKILFNENMFDMRRFDHSLINKLKEDSTNLSLKWKLGHLLFDRRV